LAPFYAPGVPHSVERDREEEEDAMAIASILCALLCAYHADMTASTPPEWTVVYHSPGKFKGRGEFLRLMLEDAGKTYANQGEEMYGPTGMMDCFRGSVEAIDSDLNKSPFPFSTFFPPAIWHRPANGEEVLINQVGACMIYLGDKLGYAPASAAEKARADCIMLNCLDLIAEGRSSFHPVKNSMSYHDQKEEGDKVSKEFSQGRLKTYLHHFNKVVVRNGGPKKPVAGGPGITYADFALFHVLDATAFQFNSALYEQAWDSTNVPALKEYYAWMKARPNLQAYFQSDRCARKCHSSKFNVLCLSFLVVLPQFILLTSLFMIYSFRRRQYDVNSR
jgi:glutathione S-transferase